MITIHNRQSLISVDLERLEQRLQMAIVAESPADVDLTVVLIDDAEIHRLNREFLKHDRPTDVNNFFDEDAEENPDSDGIRGCDRNLTGELIISVETAQREAVRQGWGIDDELLLYSVHGWLHLCGYDDLTDEERPRMRQREREIMGLFGLTPQNLEA
jgi:probable rRNA maturation factor